MFKKRPTKVAPGPSGVEDLSSNSAPPISGPNGTHRFRPHVGVSLWSIDLDIEIICDRMKNTFYTRTVST